MHAPRRGRPRRGSRSALTYCSTFVRRAQQPFRTSWRSVKWWRKRRKRTRSARGRRGRRWRTGLRKPGTNPETQNAAPAFSAAVTATVAVAATPDRPSSLRPAPPFHPSSPNIAGSADLKLIPLYASNRAAIATKLSYPSPSFSLSLFISSCLLFRG